MTDDYLAIILPLVCGFGSGVFVSLASGTAASVMIPCLTIFIGYSIHLAIGTSLVVDCIIGGIAGLIFLRSGNVDMRSGFLLAVTGVIGAIIGSRFTSGTSASGLGVFIGLILIFTGVNFIIKGVRKNIDYIETKINLKLFKNNKIPFLVIFGLIIGFISGFSGMGGSRMVALILIFILGYDIHTAIGTSLLMMFFIAGSGAISHGFNNEVIVSAALVAGCAAAVGAVSGSLVANQIDEDKLGRLVGSVLLGLGILILLKIFFNIL
ncbi:MAG: sulfite exporter TauE/SafE family protein [Thermoplasmatales archaeon]|nr:MAG: sulfite exporter TauE/SafE family protein [Thermoplasmatales archaeon]